MKSFRRAASVALLPSTRYVDCDWCSPVRPFYPLCSRRRSFPYCYYCCSCCCFCLCCVGTSSFFLYRLSCPILDAAVLLLYYADAAETPIFPSIFQLEPPTRFSDISFLPLLPVLPFRSAKLPTAVPTFLHFGNHYYFYFCWIEKACH